VSASEEHALQLARNVLETEAAAVSALIARIDALFLKAVRCVMECKGRVVVSGVGKSGHIGSKLAATFASTGTPAFFVHPGEAAHGDLGMITRDDVVIAISHSGESQELLTILPAIKRHGAKVIAMTGRPGSTLAAEADIHLDASVSQEACPLNLAPTSSTTAALALGDALAMAVLDARGFTAEDFARTHPGGTLGRRLLVHVRDIMHAGDRLPLVSAGASLKDALLEMSRKGLGMTAIVEEQNTLTGVFTDGDLRRTLDRGVDIHAAAIDEVMTRKPKTIRADALAVEAAQIMEERRINGLLVVDADGGLVGALNMHDLLRAGVV
jgi:arabinose-5-phosphate isomerase